IHVALGGPYHGKLILDPDGNRIECDQSNFLWHERDAAGNIIALNDEIEYRIGTYAPYVGAVPDTTHPGQVVPVWGTGEVVNLAAAAVDASNSLQQTVYKYNVHPESGKPDHLISGSQLNGGSDPVLE